MKKNKLHLMIVILLVAFTVTSVFLRISQPLNPLTGQIVAENLEYTSGYVVFHKYAVSGYAKGEEKSINLPYSEYLRIKQAIQEVSAESVKVTNYRNADGLHYISHVFNFKTNGSLIIGASYSQDFNQIYFSYAEIFRNDENRPIYDTRVIILNMNDSFREIVNSLENLNTED